MIDLIYYIISIQQQFTKGISVKHCKRIRKG